MKKPSKMTPEWRAKIAVSRRAQEAAKKQLKLASYEQIPGIAGQVKKDDILAYSTLIETQYGIRNFPEAGAISGLLESSSNGQLRSLMELFDLIAEKDTQLGALVNLRKTAVSGKTLCVEASETDDASKALAEFIQYCIKRINNLTDGVRHLLDAVYRGISVVEIRWGYNKESNVYLPVELVPVHGKKLGFDNDFNVKFFDNYENPELNNKLLKEFPNQFIVHTPMTLSIYPNKDGLYRSAVWFTWFKNKSLAYWLNGAERFAVPTIYAKVPKMTAAEVMLDLRRSLATLTSAGVAAFKSDVEINTLTSGMGGGDAVWMGLVKYCDAQLTKLIAGGTLTIDAGNAGSYALGEVHERSRQDLLEGDGEALCRTLERDLFAAIVRMNSHILDESAAIPTCYFDGLIQYKPIDPAAISAGVVRRNDILREKGLPEIPKEEGGEDFILGDNQIATIQGILSNVALIPDVKRDFLSIAVPSLSKKQIKALVPEEKIVEEIIPEDGVEQLPTEEVVSNKVLTLEVGQRFKDSEDGHELQITRLDEDNVYFLDLSSNKPERQWAWKRKTFLERCIYIETPEVVDEIKPAI